MKTLNRIPLELIFWVTALILLATAQPQDQLQGSHFTLCPLANLGIEWCPGCGLGRSITQLLHGNIAKSLEFHWLGIPALLIICCRIITLIRMKTQRIFNIEGKENNYV